MKALLNTHACAGVVVRPCGAPVRGGLHLCPPVDVCTWSGALSSSSVMQCCHTRQMAVAYLVREGGGGLHFHHDELAARSAAYVRIYFQVACAPSELACDRACERATPLLATKSVCSATPLLATPRCDLKPCHTLRCTALSGRAGCSSRAGLSLCLTRCSEFRIPHRH